MDVTGQAGADYFKKVMGQHSGASDVIAELGIGLNPHVRKVTGNLATDEKILGTIHLAVGDNRALGGTQESSFHHDLVMEEPTVTVDGKLLMDRGKLLV